MAMRCEEGHSAWLAFAADADDAEEAAVAAVVGAGSGIAQG